LGVLARRIAAIKEAGFDPVTLDHEALALWTRSIKELPPSNANEPRILVSLHEKHTVVIMGQGRRILGGHHIRGTDPAAILRVLDSYRRADMPATARWCWTGPAATPDRVSSFVGATHAAWPGTSTVHDDPATFLARSVAARELSNDDLPCNLRSGPLAHPSRRLRQLRRSTLAACVTLVCASLMIAASLTANYLGTEREEALAMKVARLTERLAGFRVTARGEDALRVVRTAVDARIEALQPFRRQLIDSPAAILPEVLDSAQRNGLQIETLTLTPRRLSIAGTALAWRSCDDLIMRLEHRLMKTRLERRDARDDLRIPFALTAEAPDG
jgi:hypothetical protein